MSRFASRILKWYRKNSRTLPWRQNPDPYAVWVSEIMLQQTRVDTVIPYFERWMKKFPTIKTLAKASEREVLNQWEGLGYYSRARNLRNAARILINQFGGELPKELNALGKLPGIGRYTVGAIASMAFKMDEPTLDGNLRRVFARVFNVSEPVGSTSGERIFWNIAAKHLPRGEASDYNQALMDLGAILCLPRNPHCSICPVLDLCKARELGIQDQRPVRKYKNKMPHFLQTAAVVIKSGRVLMTKRPSKGLLGGMWEFPNARVSSNGDVDGSPAKQMRRVVELAYPIKVRRTKALEVVQHAYSHFSVTVYPFLCELVTISKHKGLRWINIMKLEEYPMGRIDRKIARQLSNLERKKRDARYL